MNGIELLRKLRKEMGIEDEPGTCRDCGGSGVVPDIAQTEDTGPGVWAPCPTCNGDRRGGIA